MQIANTDAPEIDTRSVEVVEVLGSYHYFMFHDQGNINNEISKRCATASLRGAFRSGI